MTPRRKDRPQRISEIVAMLREEKAPVVIDDDVETQLFDQEEPNSKEKKSIGFLGSLSNNPLLKKVMVGVLAALVVLCVVILAWKAMGTTHEDVSQVVESPHVEEAELDYTLQGEDGSAVTKFHYKGQVVDGVPEGKGVGEYAEGVYEGNYHAGKREDSHAVMTMTNGDVYDGSWEDDYYARGRYTMSESGMYYEGDYRHGEPYNGTYYNQDGSVYNHVKEGKEVK